MFYFGVTLFFSKVTPLTLLTLLSISILIIEAQVICNSMASNGIRKGELVIVVSFFGVVIVSVSVSKYFNMSLYFCLL